MYELPDIRNIDVKGKTVFLRADLDVPLAQPSTRLPKPGTGGQAINRQQTTIEDDTRLQAGFPTVQYLLEHGAKVIIGGHLDRPKGRDESHSLQPVAVWLHENIKYHPFGKLRANIKNTYKKLKINDFDRWKINDNLFLLENLRFYEGEENPSTSSGQEFVKKLASLADIYVNDAFAMCHRDHASMTGITHNLPHFAGLHLQKEVEVLGSVLKDPKRPLVAIIGGKKIETKLPLVLKMYNLADYILVGGKIAQEKASLGTICQRETHKCANLVVAQLNKDGSDITTGDLEKFLEVIEKAKTVVWNGPMGIINGKWQIDRR
ncbi:MAG: phosphoglycerate kinase [Candidatus Levyibacteriota bacterium]